jgi:lipoprotein-releasing system permease protein
MHNHEELREILMRVPGVINATPFLYTELALSSPRGVKGLMTRGVDPQSGPASIGMLEKLVSGSLDNLFWQDEDEEKPLNGIIIGQELARSLQVGVGSRVNLLAPMGRRSTAGAAPRVAPFVVAGIFSTGMFQYDTSLGFVSLEAARELMGIRDDRVSGMELAVADVFQAGEIAEKLPGLLNPNYTIRTWMESNVNIFAALQLEKLAMGIVLFLIVLVASFSIIASLIRLVMEKTRDIAVLMSMGATRDSISKIFRLQGVIIGLIGTVAGLGAGTLLCFLLKHYKFIKLPEGAYPMSYVPVLLQWQDLAAIILGALLICCLATLYPAAQASRLSPAEALRAE